MTTPLPVVVVIEDDADARTAMARVLNAGGFEAAPYSSAEMYLDAPPARRPLCLLLDVHLRGMSGLELQGRLNAARSSIPTIVMTAFDDPRVRAQARRLGCVAYFDKSANAVELLQVIRSFLPPRQ